MSIVKVRFPPSPTGYCHVGTARMAILNYLFARKHGGSIVFRSEDTDKERSRAEYEDDIRESLSWLGLSWDEFYRQSERTHVYTTALLQLIREGKAYVSEEESKKEPGVRVRPVRLKNPGTVITFADEIRGEITFDTAELKDFVIARSINDPLYHLAVVVDDHDMGITHVIRGEDHISNTPRQILIQEALGYSRPVYAHYPLHLSADRAKLSKRTGDVAVRSYREKGYLSGALLNYLATLGWTPPSGREILSLDDMVSEFELKDVHKSGAIFDLEKLRWYNRHYLHELSPGEFAAEASIILSEEMHTRGITVTDDLVLKLWPIIRERIGVWEDLREAIRDAEFDFFFKDPVLDSARISQKGVEPNVTLKHLAACAEMLTSVTEEDFTESHIKDRLWPYATSEGRGAVLWPLRYALSGLEKSPDPFVILGIIGKETALRRIEAARSQLV